MTKQPEHPVEKDESPGTSGGTALPFDPTGKTHYTAEEIHALFDGLPPATDDERTVLAAHPDRPATPEELLAFVEEMWALYRAESEDRG